jgi:glycosyltransferase involved in cell wall biosynthesis
MTKTLIHNGVNAELICPSAFGIDISGYDNHIRQHNKTTLTIGFVGTLSPHKGCHILIQAFKQLNLPNVTLKIYGNPNEFPDYCAELKALAGDMESIAFCGTFPNTQIAMVLNDLDTLVVPSLWYENTPLVVYSAFAAQCPVVASDFPGMSEVVLHQENGLVFPAGDIDALTGQLRLLVTTPELLAKLAANCKPPRTISDYVSELEVAYHANI